MLVKNQVLLMKILLQRFLLFLGSVALALFIAEGMVRLFVRVPLGTPYVMENPDTIYWNKPNVTGRHDSPGEFDYIFHTNSRGLRSPEVSMDRADRPRILCLGDSFTFGIGGGDDESWPMQLKRFLPDSNTEILNAGVMGWGLAEYWIWLKLQGVLYRPDLVIVACHASDWENAGNGLVTLDTQGDLQRHPVVRRDIGRLKRLTRWIPFYDTLMSHSALANYLKQIVIRVTRQGTTQSPASTPLEDPVQRLAPLNEALLRKIESECASIHARLLMVYIPKYEALDPSTDSDTLSRQFHDEMKLWTQKHAILFFDTTPFLQEALKREGGVSAIYHLIDGHCKPAGYAVIAQSIARFLKDHPDELLPREFSKKSPPISAPPPKSK